MSKEEFLKHWALALEILGKDFSIDVAEFYYAEFKHLKVEVFSEALRKTMVNKRYPNIPLPAEIKDNLPVIVDEVDYRKHGFSSQITFDRWNSQHNNQYKLLEDGSIKPKEGELQNV